MSLDGYCDHTAIIPDEEIHDHYTELLRNSGQTLYGRITYELMKYWKELVENPSGKKSMDEFALEMNRIPKLVFSHTLKELDWNTASLAKGTLEEEVLALKQQPGKDVLIGSRSLIIQAMNLHLIDELQLCVHPVIVGSGLSLFGNIKERTPLKLLRTKTFGCGAVIFYYQPDLI